jgi:general secretion pathway protein N
VSFHRSLSRRFLSIAVLLLAPASALTADRPPDAAVEPGAAPPSPLAGQPLDRLSATRDRPLFSPTRRPPPPPPPVVHSPEPPPPPPNVALFGVVMDGDEARAIVRAGPATGVMRVRVGDDIGGWKVVQIEGRSLVLALADRLATFTMFAGNGAGGARHGGPEGPSVDQKTPSQTQPQNQLPQNEPPPSSASTPRKPHRAKT